jgi:pimeloyl-ACP methyl ester carboxylesterase
LIELTVPGDRPVYISHATAETERALVYLHGVCGDIFAVRSWLAAASRFGTLIVMLGDKPCGSGRYRWSSSTPELHARVQRALDAAKQARAGRLDSGAAMILGYSQGATRAEFLASQFPEQYPLVLLGGAPTQPSERRLARAKAVAIVGGEREPHDQMRFGARDLAKAGVRARFWLLPDAGHGQYGPDGSRVMGEALAFLVDAAP